MCDLSTACSSGVICVFVIMTYKMHVHVLFSDILETIITQVSGRI